MQRIARSVVFPVLLGISLCGAATAWVKGGERILLVGNNMSALKSAGTQGGLDIAVRSVLASGAIDVTVDSCFQPWPAELTYIYKEGRAIEKIKNGDYDIVVLQSWLEPENVPAGSKDSLLKTVKLFNEVITASGGKTMLFMTYPNMFQAVRPNVQMYVGIMTKTAQAYEDAAALIGGAPIMPVGRVFQDFFENPPPGVVIDPGTGCLLYVPCCPTPCCGPEPHGQVPGAYGQLVSAYTFYKVLTGGKSPIGLKQTYYPGADPKIDSILQYRANLITDRYMAAHEAGVLRQDGGMARVAAGVPGPASALFLLDGSRFCHEAERMDGRAPCMLIRSDGRTAVRSLFTATADERRR